MVTSLSPDTALVLFSGGQDSTVCLAWALDRFARVETIGFGYGQRHGVELAAARGLDQRLVREGALGTEVADAHVLRITPACGGERRPPA